jgi:hypothetical protein
MMSQILALQALRASFSALSSGVSSRSFSAGVVAAGGCAAPAPVPSAAKAEEQTNKSAANEAAKPSACLIRFS